MVKPHCPVGADMGIKDRRGGVSSSIGGLIYELSDRGANCTEQTCCLDGGMMQAGLWQVPCKDQEM